MSFAREKIRLRILKEAGELFLQQGYSKTRMEDFVNILGISKNTLYQNFSHKGEILKAVAVYKQDRLARKIKRIREKRNSEFSDRFTRICRELLGVPHSNYYQVLSEIKEQVPDIWRFIRENRVGSVEREITNLLEEGKVLGEIREDLKPELLIMAMTACSEALFGPETLLKTGDKRSETLSELDNMILYGIIKAGKKSDLIGTEPKNRFQGKREGI